MSSNGTSSLIMALISGLRRPRSVLMLVRRQRWQLVKIDMSTEEARVCV